ncbi:MAG: MBOAT family protein [Steroidobacteraceae bacterium]|nr:MBOAT family protein [Steroidobacteraceae bacterium]
MIFNSAAFLFFFAAFFPIYWLIHKNIRLRNAWVLVASYYFYGSWDWRFLSLLMFTTAMDFYIGRAVHAAPADDTRRRKRLLALSVISNVGILATFKYCGFFVDSFVDFLGAFGIEAHRPTLNIVLPVGISFYTFQSLSYTIDVYRGQTKPGASLLNFAAYVAFFPQLVAGPIERSSRLLPQIEGPVSFNARQATDGAWLILWGLIKKMLVADRIAPYVDAVFDSPDAFSPATCVTAVLFFAVQIYCDFSGYSDIARGTAKLLGVELMVNFDMPYFASSLRDFWRRWHISLSTWFRDYVFIPLGGSKGSPLLTKRNVLIVFAVSGLWHGAAYTFLIWGLLHGIGYLLDPFSKPPGTVGQRHPALRTVAGWATTFVFVNLAWLFFRAPTLDGALSMLIRIVSPSAWASSLAGSEFWAPVAMSNSELAAAALLITMVFLTEWVARGKGVDHAMRTAPLPVRWAYSWLLLGCFLLMPPSDSGAFIYFQF